MAKEAQRASPNELVGRDQVIPQRIAATCKGDELGTLVAHTDVLFPHVDVDVPHKDHFWEQLAAGIILLHHLPVVHEQLLELVVFGVDAVLHANR